MRADPIRERLDERRAVAAPRFVGRVLDDLVDREHVVAVGAQRLDAVAERLERDRLAAVWSVPGVEIAHWLFWQISTTGALHHAGEVHRDVEVAFARAAVAHVAEAPGRDRP